MARFILTEDDLLSVAGLSNSKAAAELGVGKTTVQEARKRAATPATATLPGYSFERKPDGTIIANTRPSMGPQSLREANDLLKSKDVDLSSHNISYGYVEKELASGKTTHQYSIRAVPKKVEAVESTLTKLDADELLASIDRYNFTAVIKSYRPESLIVTPADMQIGKTSFHGGTEQTVERVLDAFERAAEFAMEFEPQEIVIGELGDPLENFYSTSSQRETNDLDLTGQIRVARRLLLEGVKILAPWAPVIRYASVPSNHGSVRVGFKAPAGDNHNDWGLEIASQIEDAVRENNSLDHVVFHRPEHLYESLLLETSGTKIGMVHGHQARSADKLGEWWKGQDHGRQPTAQADILLSGHWHSFRVQHSGNGRWVMVSPSSDPGSDWFTNITGEWSESGMLTFTTANGKWDNLGIL